MVWRANLKRIRERYSVYVQGLVEVSERLHIGHIYCCDKQNTHGQIKTDSVKESLVVSVPKQGNTGKGVW